MVMGAQLVCFTPDQYEWNGVPCHVHNSEYGDATAESNVCPYLILGSCRTVDSNWTNASPASAKESGVSWLEKCDGQKLNEGAAYSMRKACTGLMEAARRAGMIPAIAAATPRVTIAPVMTARLTLVIS
jgi:hypothetical protein